MLTLDISNEETLLFETTPNFLVIAKGKYIPSSTREKYGLENIVVILTLRKPELRKVIAILQAISRDVTLE